MPEAIPDGGALILAPDVGEAEALPVAAVPFGATIVAGTQAAHERLGSLGLEGRAPEALGLGPHIRRQARERIRNVAQCLCDDPALTVEGAPLGRFIWDPLFRALTPLMTGLLAGDVVLERHRPSQLLVPVAASPSAMMRSLEYLDGVSAVAESRGVACGALWPPAAALRRTLRRLWRPWRVAAGSHLIVRSFLLPRLSPCRRPREADIVVSPWSAAEQASLLPVAEALLARNARLAAVETPHYYALAPTGARAHEAVPRYLLGCFSRGADWAVALRAARSVAAHVKARIADDTVPALLDRDRAAGLAEAGALLRLPIALAWEAARARLSYDASRRCFDQLGARLVLASKCRGVEMSPFLIAAASLGTPSVFLPHGLYADDAAWRAVPATLVLADGPLLAEILISRGQSADALAIVGQPKYDAALSAVPAGREALCHGLGLDPAGRFVCVAGTGDAGFARSACASLAPEAGRRGWRLLVRLHPRLANEGERRRVREAAGTEPLQFPDDDPLLLYAVSQVVVTGVSTAAIEAMLVGTPVVYVGGLEEDVHGYAEAGAVARAADPSHLASTVAEVMDAPSRRAELIARGREFAATRFVGTDGRAAERCAGAILALANGASVTDVIASLAAYRPERSPQPHG